MTIPSRIIVTSFLVDEDTHDRIVPAACGAAMIDPSSQMRRIRTHPKLQPGLARFRIPTAGDPQLSPKACHATCWGGAEDTVSRRPL